MSNLGCGENPGVARKQSPRHSQTINPYLDLRRASAYSPIITGPLPPSPRVQTSAGRAYGEAVPVSLPIRSFRTLHTRLTIISSLFAPASFPRSHDVKPDRYSRPPHRRSPFLLVKLGKASVDPHDREKERDMHFERSTLADILQLLFQARSYIERPKQVVWSSPEPAEQTWRLGPRFGAGRLCPSERLRPG